MLEVQSLFACLVGSCFACAWRWAGVLGLVIVAGCADSLPPAPVAPSQVAAVPVPAEPQPAGTEKDSPVHPPEAPEELKEPNESTVTDKLAFDAERLKLAMVSIATPGEGVIGYGVVVQKSSTGFDVVTADHVLEGRQRLTVQAWHQQVGDEILQTLMSVTIMHRAPEQDLAWLRIREANSSVVPVSLGKTSDRGGQVVWTYQVDNERAVFQPFKIQQRITAQRSTNVPPVSYWRLTSRIEPGQSGGGLLDSQGQWIGIASGNNQNQAHYIDELEIARFLKSVGLD